MENGGIYDDASCEVKIDSGLENSLSILKTLNNLKILDNIIRQNNFDIVHLNGSMFGLLGRILSLKYKNIRFIYTLHGIPWGEGRSFLMSFLMKTVEKLLSRTESNIICISKKILILIKKLHIRKYRTSQTLYHLMKLILITNMKKLVGKEFNMCGKV